MMRFFNSGANLVGVILTALALISSASLLADMPSKNSGACQFESFAEWSAHAVRWTGSCEKGRAAGLGVLRAYAKGKLAGVFYGRLVAGQPVLGVIEYSDGFVAGEVVAGVIQPTENRQIIIRAFAVAAQAAHRVSEILEIEGNAASARYYANKAEQLANQMD